MSKGMELSNRHIKVNWCHHASNLKNFSCQSEFLSSSFLFSLPSQKPGKEVTMFTLGIQRAGSIQTSQVDQAWNVLCSLQEKCKNNLRLRLTQKIENCGKISMVSKPRELDAKRITGVTGPKISYSVKTGSDDRNGTHHILANVSDIDDEVLMNIDVDKIIHEHYQAIGLYKTSATVSSVLTPALERGYTMRSFEDSLSLMLSEQCDQIFKEMEDQHVAVSNNFFDNTSEFIYQWCKTPRQRSFCMLETVTTALNKRKKDKENQLPLFRPPS